MESHDLPPRNNPFLFNPLEPQEQGLCDFDSWGNLFSAQNSLLLLNGDAKETIQRASSSSLMAQNKVVCEEEKGSKEKRKGVRVKKTTRVPRFAFQTRSADDVLDDGYRWRKYGQKSKLLPVHAPHVQCEETSAKAVKRHKHCGDNVRGNSQPSMREADGNSNPSAEANTVSC
ncbi:WRKY transcription factor 24 WRKY DNA-binding protein [Vigna angularis]|uniref:WRKY transcription factor 24 WRKY DNA-binding protein n=1 Tax=Phaseolus angularis TaxID=3914 RepID=A0A8T0KYF3_PHAAN|nr:WRKY transcription factor 24 WRKY DNA-binding protein [Vigna angularis]